MLGIYIGLLFWGLTAGIAMVNAGLSTVDAVGMNMTAYTGSAQLAILPLLLLKAPLWIICLTGFFVCIRFLAFGAQLRPYVMHMPFWSRITVAFLITEAQYVLFVRRFQTAGRTTAQKNQQVAYLWAVGVTGWWCWQLSSTAGILLANYIPASWGLGFAGISAILAVTCSLATTWMRAGAALLAGALALIFYDMPFHLNVLGAIVVTTWYCVMTESNRIQIGR